MSGGTIQKAFGLHRAGKLDEAAKVYSEILRSEPRQVDALYLLGSVHFQRGEFSDALARFDEALAIKPRFIEAMAGRGAALSNFGRQEEALTAYETVLAASPDHAQSWNNRGNTLLVLGREQDALASYDRALSLVPNYVDAWRNRATALLRTGRIEEALANFERALELKPDFAVAWEDYATVLARLGRREDAIVAYDRALALTPDNPDLLYNRGNLHAILRRYDEAIHDCEATLARAPDYPYARGVLIHSKLQSCNWRGLDAEIWNISMALAAGKRVVSPFNLKALSDSPPEHLRVAQIWTANEAPAPPFLASKPLGQSPRDTHDRIRLAYVSGDFNSSAVATLMAGVFEHHDRRMFETIAVSFGPAASTPTRVRLESAFERFVDMRGRSDGEIANLLRDMEADIAVDLMGYTGECRTAIFAQRPAPVQVNYLGFPGTMGASYMDYIIADSTVVPEDQQRHYAEAVAYLPHCYLPADRARGVAETIPSRAEAGLPQDGFVFVSFNNSYKFNPVMFGVWMRLLRAVEGSVLWLPETNLAARRNLVREAEARAVAPARIVFAPLVPDAGEHLARLSLGDLFLDTLPYNAHTTASDALWAGVPVLTQIGNSFAGRVAASALKAVGLAELIARTPDEYEAIALALARDPVRLGEIRAKLGRNRLTTPLFDTAGFTRDLETVFTTMWARHRRGEMPASFAVAATD
ncbi:MAG TPA: tetratricopeptide repeat protein [Micropepsaceae bacterium]